MKKAAICGLFFSLIDSEESFTLDRQIPEHCHSERSEESFYGTDRILVPRIDKDRSIDIQSEAKNLFMG